MAEDFQQFAIDPKGMVIINNNLVPIQAAEAIIAQMIESGQLNEQFKPQFAHYSQSAKKPSADYQLVQALKNSQAPNGLKVYSNPQSQMEQ